MRTNLAVATARTLLLVGCFLVAAATSFSQLSPEIEARIDKAAADSLASTGVPSASVAVVKDGKIAYLKAYGDAKLDPKTPATSTMRYSIGSISKQFTATAVLMLAEHGKLSLDDKVGKYIPDLTRANEVTIRQLLSHTSSAPSSFIMRGVLNPRTSRPHAKLHRCLQSTGVVVFSSTMRLRRCGRLT